MTQSEMGREDSIIREWLDCRVTESGILVAIQRLLPRPLMQRHLLDEWMNHYRFGMRVSTSYVYCDIIILLRHPKFRRGL